MGCWLWRVACRIPVRPASNNKRTGCFHTKMGVENARKWTDEFFVTGRPAGGCREGLRFNPDTGREFKSKCRRIPIGFEG